MQVDKVSTSCPILLVNYDDQCQLTFNIPRPDVSKVYSMHMLCLAMHIRSSILVLDSVV